MSNLGSKRPSSTPAHPPKYITFAMCSTSASLTSQKNVAPPIRSGLRRAIPWETFQGCRSDGSWVRGTASAVAGKSQALGAPRTTKIGVGRRASKAERGELLPCAAFLAGCFGGLTSQP